MLRFEVLSGFKNSVVPEFILGDGLRESLNSEKIWGSSHSDQRVQFRKDVVSQPIVGKREEFGVFSASHEHGEKCVFTRGSIGKDGGGEEGSQNLSVFLRWAEESETVERVCNLVPVNAHLNRDHRGIGYRVEVGGEGRIEGMEQVRCGMSRCGEDDLVG
jgi:hypothetical protein